MPPTLRHSPTCPTSFGDNSFLPSLNSRLPPREISDLGASLTGAQKWTKPQDCTESATRAEASQPIPLQGPTELSSLHRLPRTAGFPAFPHFLPPTRLHPSPSAQSASTVHRTRPPLSLGPSSSFSLQHCLMQAFISACLTRSLLSDFTER